MFQFLRRRPKDLADPLLSPKTALEWFRKLPAHDGIGRHQKVIEAFDDFRRSGKPIDVRRVAVLELLDAELGPYRGRLLKQYIDNAGASGAVADRVWAAAYEASQGFIGVYRRALDEAVLHAGEPAWLPVVPRLFARLIHFYGTDAKLRVLKSERWIPAKWVELHELYQRALALGVERTPLGAGRSSGGATQRTVEQEYVAVLLTHLLNAGTLTPAEIDWAGAQIRAWSQGLTLDSAPGAPGGFCVDIAGRTGLVRRADDAQESMLRYLDPAPLASQIMRAIIAIRRPRATDRDAAGIKAQQRLRTLEKLRSVLTPNQQGTLSREPRVQLSRAVEVRIGLARICQEPALQGGGIAFDAGAQRGAKREPNDASASFRPEDVKTHGRAPGKGAGDSGWRVEDRSAGGMRIKAAVDAGQGLALGTLIAVCETGAENWVLGVVRRHNRSATAVDAGISIIARDVSVVPLNVKRQAREDMSIVVDGIDVSTLGARFDGLYLPPPSRPDKPIRVKTLIIPTTEFAVGRNLVMITGHTVYTIALKKVVEQRAEWTWAGMEIVAQVGRS